MSSIPPDVHEIESKLHDSPCDMALWCSLIKAVNHGTDGSHQHTRVNHSVEVSHKFTLNVLELPSGSSLEEHLVHLQRETPLEEPIRCEICGAEHANSTRTYSCHSSAPLLMFHLERYIWPGPKHATDVGVPEVLQFCDQRWDLSAVVCHIGPLPSEGHYIIHVKAQQGWHQISDMDVRREDFDTVCKSAGKDGLLLLYRQRIINLNPRNLATREDLTMDDAHRIDLDAANPIPDTVDWMDFAFAADDDVLAAAEDLLPPVIEPARATPMHSFRFGRSRRLVDAEQDLQVDDLSPSHVQEAQSPSSGIEHAKVQAVKAHLRLSPGASVSEACNAVGMSRASYYRHRYVIMSQLFYASCTGTPEAPNRRTRKRSAADSVVIGSGSSPTQREDGHCNGRTSHVVNSAPRADCSNCQRGACG